MTPEINKKFAELKSINGADSLERVEAMLNPLLAKREPLQAGAKFIVPGLSTTPWLDIKDYPAIHPLVSRLEKEAANIKREVNDAINGQSELIGQYKHYLGQQSNWDALYLFQKGAQVEQAQYQVPVTWDIFQNELRDWHCPLLEVHFSVLKGGAIIKPHCDLWNFTINLHLAVEIPDNCELVVANEPRNWDEGRCLLFDYSYEHSAYNHSDKKRICLLMDIWHPDLSMAEREALTFLVRAVRQLMGE
ncbi:hypothetical protein PULV_a3987 [Pseudoalteromonas ulvae UL12]|uniref:aspartyl/asparaginyl beta-hydroxylase domain-containing protein n=1 Tax=Pseudoalteromonas ulvae TaxID=107327 RepID=UPI00186BA4FD|nr:aspartyl/asparaginyl beta-hydroxylase domain-containing protein [Pseudoalteromonas ulvae]MBE0362179.1 hypothetical protein [Pseudoalteromonas ulvae UL12]